MRIRVKLIPGPKARALEIKKSRVIAEDVLKILGLNRENVVVRRGGRPIPECEPVMSGDNLEILTIISGG